VLEAHARLGHCPRRPPDSTSPIHPIQSCHVIQAHLVSQANILIDKDGASRIGGLGNAFTLPNPAAQIVEGRMGTNRLSRACAPELTVPGASRDVTDPKPRTKASDMYAFGVMTFEVWTDTSGRYFLTHSRQVLTGQLPFSEMTEIAATYSMLSGDRPLRPNHQEISVPLWYMLERCWHRVPSKRMTAGEVLNLLETELRSQSDSPE